MSPSVTTLFVNDLEIVYRISPWMLLRSRGVGAGGVDIVCGVGD